MYISEAFLTVRTIPAPYGNTVSVATELTPDPVKGEGNAFAVIADDRVTRRSVLRRTAIDFRQSA